jgi:hypothetical protein
VSVRGKEQQRCFKQQLIILPTGLIGLTSWELYSCNMKFISARPSSKHVHYCDHISRAMFKRIPIRSSVSSISMAWP